MTEQSGQLPSQESLQRGYEPSGVGNRGMLIFFAIFLLVAAILQFGIWGLLKLYMHTPRPIDTVTSIAPAQARFPPPNLQPTQEHNKLPHEDLMDLMKKKDEIFQRMGWRLDPQSGVPVIPDSIVDQLARERSGKESKP